MTSLVCHIMTFRQIIPVRIGCLQASSDSRHRNSEAMMLLAVAIRRREVGSDRLLYYINKAIKAIIISILIIIGVIKVYKQEEDITKKIRIINTDKAYKVKRLYTIRLKLYFIEIILVVRKVKRGRQE
ncbi:hypothetical protein IWW34DRAFT_789380 [Fusarium oxysporum f. sp. albedinis]|nr:hypothetical protein IWW34DRAFT_789380 [Fusarium oxysporum f. sp. albedinis]